MSNPYGKRLIGDVYSLLTATPLQYDRTVVMLDNDFETVPDLAIQVVDLRCIIDQ
jgi:predicted nucleic acid-binding protein